MQHPGDRQARDLSIGDIYRIHVYGEVLSVKPMPAASGSRCASLLRIKGGVQTAARSTTPTNGSLTNEGHVLEFICKPGRVFHLTEWDEDDDDGDDESPMAPIAPETVDAG
jgi:hypothetical protein